MNCIKENGSVRNLGLDTFQLRTGQVPTFSSRFVNGFFILPLVNDLNLINDVNRKLSTIVNSTAYKFVKIVNGAAVNGHL